jgi:signal transduction histidine kinase
MTYSPGADLAAVAAIEAVPTILDVICQVTGMGFAAVARVTEDRWIACGVRDDIAFGLTPGGELKVETTICHEIREQRQPVVINHVAKHPTYCHHATPAMYGFQSYISMPIILANGTFFGTLCAIDPRPNHLDRPEIISMFKLFSEMIAFHLNAVAKVESSTAALAQERENATLREQFIAVLAHDLRYPLAAIDAASRIAGKNAVNQDVADMLVHIQRSVSRMVGLINNVTDFARGRLGGGMQLKRDAADPLEPMLEQVLSELKGIWPERQIDAHFALEEPVACDRVRIGQLFSNLLGNAITHGAEDQPIRVTATAVNGVFELEVANRGNPISKAATERLFQPFFRGDVRPHQEGLGLGLFIASQIAHAHHGTLEVDSNEDETRFTLTMPTGSDPAAQLELAPS